MLNPIRSMLFGRYTHDPGSARSYSQFLEGVGGTGVTINKDEDGTSAQIDDLGERTDATEIGDGIHAR